MDVQNCETRECLENAIPGSRATVVRRLLSGGEGTQTVPDRMMGSMKAARDSPGCARRTGLLVAATLWIAACAGPQTRDDYAERVELLALVQTLNADLLSHDSATLTLERWCADHRLADPPRIVAHRVRGESRAIPEELRARLAVEPGDRIAYRHVQLACGDHVLSEADNWYVAARLTAEMNERLDTTDEPFGKVVAALGFQRRTLSADLLWSPLPAGWEMTDAAHQTPAPLQIPHAVLRHQAVLYTAAQIPFSVVTETYTNELFAFRNPRRD